MKRLVLSVLVGLISIMGALPRAHAIAWKEEANPNNFIFSKPEAFIPLNPDGATKMDLQAGSYVLTFSAECGVSGSTARPYLDIDILIDDTVVYPTNGNQDAFCTGVGKDKPMLWTRASITLAFTLVYPQSISVKARLDNGATKGSIGNLVLVAQK